MIKRCFSLLVLILCLAAAKAQTADIVLLNRLGDFDMATLSGDANTAISIGEKILPDTAKMGPKVRINFFAKLAKAYDDGDEDAKAISYYEKVVAAEPNYYVAQRGLGYLYNAKAEDIQLKLYITPKDSPDYKALFESYRKDVQKALPLLEKAQACDADDDTLDLIRTLYMKIHDEQGLNSLKSRLPGLAKNCVDLLSDK
jgi:tetratricopeptide (TPR) repeat protein